MAIYSTNDLTQRIRQGDISIKRVYQGNDLVFGLYEITYYDRGNKLDASPKEYVWGCAEELPVLSDVVETYQCHFFGWYEGNTYVTAVPAITKDLHKDLKLFAKWKQKQFQYSGTYVYNEGGGFSPRLSEPDWSSPYWIKTTKGGYNKCIAIDSSTGLVVPNCTGYAWGRYLEEAGLETCSLSTGDACNWYGSAPYRKSSNMSDAELGAVCCWSDDTTPGEMGHVAIVEAISSTGITCSESGYGSSSKWWTANYSFSNSLSFTSRAGHKHTFQGFIFNDEIQSEVTGSVDWTSSGLSQTSPSFPSPPKGKWKSQNKRTLERAFKYNADGSGSWGSDSDWAVTDSSNWNQNWS